MALDFSVDLLFCFCICFLRKAELSTFRILTDSGLVMVNQLQKRVVAEVSANFTAVVHTCSYYTFIHCYFPKKQSNVGGDATVKSKEL